MSIKRLLIKNSLYNLASYVYLALASLISIPFLLKYLGVSQYAIYILFSGLTVLATTFDFGLSQATIRWLSLPDLTAKEKSRVYRTSLYLFLLIATVLSLSSFLLINLLLPHIRIFSTLPSSTFLSLGLVLSAIIFINHLNIFLLALPQALNRFDTYNTRALFVGTANTFLSVLVARFFPQITYLFLIQLAFHLLTFFSLLHFAKKHIEGYLSPHYHRPYGRQLLNFGLRNFVTGIANQFRVQFSNFALGGLLTPAAVAAFSIPQNLVIKAAGGVSQLTLAFFPLSTSLLTKERINKLKQLIVQLELLILCLGLFQIAVVYLFGDAILLWWLKDASVVALAAPVLKVLSWFFLLTVLTPIPTAVMDSLNHPEISSIIATANTVITLIFIYLLTPRFGALGPAYANVIGSLILVPVFLAIFVRRFHAHAKTLR